MSAGEVADGAAIAGPDVEPELDVPLPELGVFEDEPLIEPVLLPDMPLVELEPDDIPEPVVPVGDVPEPIAPGLEEEPVPALVEPVLPLVELSVLLDGEPLLEPMLDVEGLVDEVEGDVALVLGVDEVLVVAGVVVS